MYFKLNVRMISKIKIIIAGAVLFFVAACSLKSNNENQNIVTNVKGVTSVKFDTLYHNFANLVQGEKVSYIFKFKNIGTTDLIIKDAYSTCGCTVANYTKEPVSANNYGVVDIVFDSAGRQGVQYKNIVLEMNTKQEKHTLSIRANVIKK